MTTIRITSASTWPTISMVLFNFKPLLRVTTLIFLYLLQLARLWSKIKRQLINQSAYSTCLCNSVGCTFCELLSHTCASAITKESVGVGSAATVFCFLKERALSWPNLLSVGKFPLLLLNCWSSYHLLLLQYSLLMNVILRVPCLILEKATHRYQELIIHVSLLRTLKQISKYEFF